MTSISSKNIFFGLAAFAVLALVVAIPIASAYRGDPSIEGPQYNEERHELMTQAFESGDYATWKTLMEEAGVQGRVLDVVTEDNFDIFVEAHNAALAGDVERAAELRAELGLNNGVGPRDGSGYQGQHKGMRGQQGSFVDADGDGACDHARAYSGQGRGMNRGAQ